MSKIELPGKIKDQMAAEKKKEEKLIKESASEGKTLDSWLDDLQAKTPEEQTRALGASIMSVMTIINDLSSRFNNVDVAAFMALNYARTQNPDVGQIAGAEADKTRKIIETYLTNASKEKKEA